MCFFRKSDNAWGIACYTGSYVSGAAPDWKQNVKKPEGRKVMRPCFC